MDKKTKEFVKNIAKGLKQIKEGKGLTKEQVFGKGKIQKKINDLKDKVNFLRKKDLKRLEQAQQDHYEIKKFQRILKILMPEVCKLQLKGEQAEAVSEYQYYIKQIERNKREKAETPLKKQ